MQKAEGEEYNAILEREVMMAIGVVGRKVGMTRVFSEAGVSEPVTVIHVVPNRVSQVKTQSVDGYDAIQVHWRR